MAKKLTPEELRKQADKLRERAKEAVKEAKKLERKEERERIALAKKQERIEWLSLLEVAKVGTLNITENGERISITVLEYLRRLKAEQEEENAKREAEEKAKKQEEKQTET